jgi:putative zinc finger protein
MDHQEAVRQKATEKYLLNELGPGLRDEFEEHLFDCQDCALDVRSAAMFVEQSKAVLAEEPAAAPMRIPVPVPARGWLGWLRPAFAVPVLALLLAVIGYQNFVTYPRLQEAANTPQVLPWASINVSTRGSTAPVVTARAGQGFNLLVSIPPESRYVSYSFDLRSPAGRLEWSSTIPAAAADDSRSIYIPGTSRPAGTYTLGIRGITVAGESSNLGRYPFELEIQK